MSRFLHTIKKEFLHALPVTFFFFVAFSLVDLSAILLQKHVSATYASLGVIVVSSLIMGKVVLIADSLPFIGLFSKKPLIYSTTWKTLIYTLCSFFVRFMEKIVPSLIEGKDPFIIKEELVFELGKTLFWIAQAWLFVLFFIFVAYQELIFAVGQEKVYALFFGKKTK